MKRFTALLILVIVASAAFGHSMQKTANVSVSSRGSDVRGVLHDLFTQSNKNYIIDTGIRMQPLYLSLKDVEFDEAVEQICKLCELKFELQNGIFYFTKALKPATVVKTGGEKPTQKPDPVFEAPKGPYASTVLNKRITTKFSRIDLRDLAKELSKQTGLMIEIDPKTPKYRIDAYLTNTSLKYCLDQITTAAKLRYRLTDHQSIEIYPAVSVSAEEDGKQDK